MFRTLDEAAGEWKQLYKTSADHRRQLDEYQLKAKDYQLMFLMRTDMGKSAGEREKQVEALQNEVNQGQTDRKDDLASQTLSLAGTYANRGNFRQGYQLCDEFLPACGGTGTFTEDEAAAILAPTYRTLGRGYSSLGRWESATKSYQDAFGMCRPTPTQYHVSGIRRYLQRTGKPIPAARLFLRKRWMSCVRVKSIAGK